MTRNAIADLLKQRHCYGPKASTGYLPRTSMVQFGTILVAITAAARLLFVGLRSFFRIGEIWCTTDTLIFRAREWRPPKVPIPVMPTLPMELAFYVTLHNAVAFAVNHMELTFPAQVEFGLLNLEDMPLPTLRKRRGVQFRQTRSL